jgi:WD40 repeat protein
MGSPGGQPRQLAMDGEGRILFHPSGSAVQALDVQTGQQQFVLRGHLESINACCYNAHMQELYTAGNDHQIIVWAAPLGFNAEVDIDTWSDN